MRRLDKAGGKAAKKTQRRKTLRGRKAPEAAGRRSSLAAGKETNVAQLMRERDEALQQQTATRGPAPSCGTYSTRSSKLPPACVTLNSVFCFVVMGIFIGARRFTDIRSSLRRSTQRTRSR